MMIVEMLRPFQQLRLQISLVQRFYPLTRSRQLCDSITSNGLRATTFCTIHNHIGRPTCKLEFNEDATTMFPMMHHFHTHIPSYHGQQSGVHQNVEGIQKDVFPLTTKKVVRRRRGKNSQTKDTDIYDVVALAISEVIDLQSLQEDLVKQGLYGVVPLPADIDNSLHMEALYRVENEPREIFVFSDGFVVFWNMPVVERRAVLQFIKRHEQGAYNQELVTQEKEVNAFTYIEETSHLRGDEIQLQRVLQASDLPRLQLERYTFSNALGLSVKLAIWEASLQKYIDSIDLTLQDLRYGKRIKMGRSTVLRKQGELLTLRHLINLCSDLLDTPDVYWDREPLEDLYTKTCTYLSISRRTKVMNEKLTYCCELTDLLSSHLNDKHHTKLEWMIIILITVEVLFEVFRLQTGH